MRVRFFGISLCCQRSDGSSFTGECSDLYLCPNGDGDNRQHARHSRSRNLACTVNVTPESQHDFRGSPKESYGSTYFVWFNVLALSRPFGSVVLDATVLCDDEPFYEGIWLAGDLPMNTGREWA